jgi:ubiquinone/menaquinone biosynthesis C-methylase UbiE
MSNKLNVGSGESFIEGWINLDKTSSPDIDINFDLDLIPVEKIPLDENSIDTILMSHVIEHLRNPMDVMQDLYRLAKSNATLMIRTPHGGNDEAWIDPTHIRPYFPRSFTYFSQPKYYKFDYSYLGDWRTDTIVLCTPLYQHAKKDFNSVINAINTQRNLVSELVVYLRAIKPARERKKELMSAPNTIITDSIPLGFFEPENILHGN